MGSRLAVFAAVALVLVACKGSSTPVVEAPVVASSASSTSSAAPPPSSSAASPATTAATPSDPTKHCMMVNVCSCNLGCAAIRVPTAELKVGTHAKSESGALAGEELKIVEMTDVTGTKVLALTDLKHDHACALPVERSLAGYACAKADSGPIPAKACAKGCS